MSDREAIENAPDFRRGFVRVPLPLFLALYCRAPLSRRQMQIVSLVIRESWGWRSREGGPRLWTRPLPTARIAEGTGLSTDRLARDVRDLVGRGILRESEGRYQIVPYPQRWEACPPDRRTPSTLSAAAGADPSPRGGSDRERKDNLKRRSKSESPDLSTVEGGRRAGALAPRSRYGADAPETSGGE